MTEAVINFLTDAGVLTMGCVFAIIGCFGGMAGIVSGFLLRKGAETVEVDPSALPGRRHFANFLVGMVGSFAFVPFGARVLDLEFVHIFNHARLEDTLKCTLFLISLAIIGGFAGYRGLATLTDKMLAKVNELDLRTKELENAKARLEVLNAEMEERSKKQVAFEGAAFAKTMEDEDLVAAATAIAKSLAIYPTKFGEFVNARVLRRKKDYSQAIAALDRALRLPPDQYFSNDASIYWNKACYLAVSASEKYADIVWNLDRSIEIKPRYHEDLTKDADLSALVDRPDFAQHFQLQLKKETP